VTRYLHYSSRPEYPQVPPRAMNFLAGGTGPLGVYAYQDDARQMTFAADRPYVFALQPRDPITYTADYTSADLERDIEQLAQVPGGAKAIRMFDKYRRDIRASDRPFAKLWYVVCHIERAPDPDEPLAYGPGSGCADPRYARELLVELGHTIIDDRDGILYSSEPEQAVFLTDESFTAIEVRMRNPPQPKFGSFREEVDYYRKEQGKRYAAIKKAFSQSNAIIVTHGGRPQLLVKSGETRIGGKPWRVSTFMPDGPWGHNEYKDDHEIFDDLSRSHYDSVAPASDDEVIAWTSTPAFQKGAAAVAMIQAENTLRYLASKSRDRQAIDDVLARAREIADPQTVASFEEATAVLEAAIRKVTPRENPPRDHFVPNPAWVTKIIAGSYDTINERVPPKWHPRLTKPRSQRGNFIAKLKEYGCGAYGCVLPTLDDKTVLKVTTDVTEAEFAGQLAATLIVPIVVDYRLVMQLGVLHQKRPVYLLWRESADDVGQLEDHPLINEQHLAAQTAYLEMYKTQTAPVGAIKYWRDTIRAMAEDPALKFLATGMLRVWDEQQIFFGDVHGGNVGRCVRGERLEWVIVDPGHVSVVKQ
jgi:hypothetical protein